jgi:phosphatidylserine synthase 2
VGLYFGMKTCEYFEMKGYSWRGIKQIPSSKGKVKRIVQQFTPHHWTKFEWGTTKSFKNYLAVLGLLFLVIHIITKIIC